MTITLGQDFWDIIAIVIALNMLYNDFNTIATNLFKSEDKIIEQIQNIL